MCNDEYKNKVKDIMNKKISVDDVKVVHSYDVCYRDSNDKQYYTGKCDKNELNCSCKVNNDEDLQSDEDLENSDIEEYSECFFRCSQKYQIMHDHTGICENISQCKCNKDHLYDCDQDHYKYYCDGSNLYQFNHDYAKHKTVYTYGCNHVCQRYHVANDPAKVILLHNNTKIDTVNKLLEEAELCGERCRFSRVSFERLIEQIK
jgi:hypothetical protein